MAYFYSEKGMRIFVVLMMILVGWLFMGVSRAAFVSRARVPEDPGRVVFRLCSEQSAKVGSETAELLVHAFAVKGEK